MAGSPSQAGIGTGVGRTSKTRNTPHPDRDRRREGHWGGRFFARKSSGVGAGKIAPVDPGLREQEMARLAKRPRRVASALSIQQRDSHARRDALLVARLAACSTNSGSLTPDASRLSVRCRARRGVERGRSLYAAQLVDAVSGGRLPVLQRSLRHQENDPLNCGGCGVRCSPPTSMCHGDCIVPTCAPACDAGSQCCLVNTAGPAQPPACYPGATCPLGCPSCT